MSDLQGAFGMFRSPQPYDILLFMSKSSDIDIAAVRAQFPALENFVWLQNGGVSITPEPVAREHIRLMEELLLRGPLHVIYPEEEYPRRRQTTERLARFLSVDADELALMRGVSEGFQTVLRGLTWNRGDRIVISGDEEAAVLLPCLHLRDRFGVEVVKLPLADDESAVLEAAAEVLTPQTKLLALSHVTTDLGFRLPVAPLCALARDRGILSFLDLAHSCGVVPMQLRQLECDYAGLLSYKWMMAPYAAGLLWARKEKMLDIEVAYAGGRAEKWLDFSTDTFELPDTAQRFQYGPWSWPLVHAWATATDWLTDIGGAAIWTRVQELTQRLKKGLAEIDGATLYTPEEADASAALVSFGLRGWRGEELAEALRQKCNIVIKPLPHSKEGLRASLPFYLLEAEVDLLSGALRELAALR
jgi:cysteine desulfurase/selenocysteine lyase